MWTNQTMCGTAVAEGHDPLVHPAPRIVIYGTGQYGQHVTRMAVESGWTIVAAYNRAGPKVGQDLGRLAGLGRDIGVVIQDCDTADFAAASADIGVVTLTNLLKLNLPAYRRLIGAGMNVICHGSQSYYPFGCHPEAAAQIDALAKGHGVTFTGSGIWDMSRIWSGILLLGPATEIRSLFHSSISSAAGQLTDAAQARQIGIGLTVEQFMSNGLGQSPIAISYKTITEHVLAATGHTIQASRVVVEPVLFDTPIDSALMGATIPAGMCVGTRIVTETETSEGVTARSEIELRLFREGEVEHMFWELDGKPHTRVRVERDDPAHATAACLFNRIPDVLAARPGIVLISELGPLKPSAPARARLSKLKSSTRGHRIALDADQLMARSRALTGIDLIDSSAIAPLHVLVKSMNEESSLHARGAQVAEGKLIKLLANRLRMQRDLLAHPEILEQPIRAPIMLGGVGRTGTTKLLKVLSATGDFNWLPLWQLHNPSLLTGDPAESPDQRIRDADEFFARFNEASPESLISHPFETHEPEEESHIYEHSLISAVPAGYTNVPSYLAWLQSQDMGEQFRFLRQTLQYLQWQGLHDPDKRWVLKSPMNVAVQPVLHAAFPDAVFVMTHRQPVKCVASLCSLLNGFTKPFSNRLVDGQILMDGLAMQLDQHLTNRALHPELNLLDLSFDSVTQSSENVAEQIYHHAGLTLSDAARDRIRAWDAANGMHSRGVHKYEPEDFGFTAEQINEKFPAYLAFFKQTFG